MAVQKRAEAGEDYVIRLTVTVPQGARSQTRALTILL